MPQLVNREMVDEIRRHADDYVECVSSRGLPRKLLDRNGRPVAVARNYNLWRPERPQRYFEDSYYPSPEMHEEAAAALMPACRRLLHPE
jgi:hypothetical protein